MVRKMLEGCPSCGGTLSITEVRCDRCDTQVRSRYRPSSFDALSEEQSTFLRIFVMSRGNLSEVEKRLGISYPTVRAKLDEVIERLAAAERQHEEPAGGFAGIGSAVASAMPNIGSIVESAVREAMRNVGPAGREAAGQAPPAEQPASARYTTRREVLEAIHRGEISAAEGMARIQALREEAAR